MKFYIIVTICLTIFTSSAMCADLTIYTEESRSGAHFTDKDGNPKGYVYELIVEMQKKMGDTTPIQFVPWARGYKLTMIKPNHALFSTTFTEERRPLFKWVGPVSQAVWIFYAKAGSGIKINALEDAKKVNLIGTYLDDVREQFLKKEGFTNLDSVPKDELNLKKLLAGRISLWAASPIAVSFAGKKLGIPIDGIEPVFTIMKKGLFIAFNKDTPDDIVNKWTKAYNDFRTDGTMEAIYKKWDKTIPTYQIPPAP
ncbi:MAG: ABC transporter substrate-binding protein [Desulfamplus sp.]|nr:ABC transporter substrate-binding protein [Desulfamplus sp.]